MENKGIRKVKRGEIYYFDFGEYENSIQNGVRPVLVVQCDEGNEVSRTTIVAAMTSSIKKRYLPSHVLLGKNFGLKQPSMVLLEQLKTVNQADLLDYVGCIEGDCYEKLINNGLKKALGLWANKLKRTGDIRCLCSECLEDYKTSSEYIVKRLDPFNKTKHRCDKCMGTGYDYLLYSKKSTQR